MIDENCAARMEADAAVFREIGADCVKLADAAGEGREALRKIDEAHGLAKGCNPAMGALGRLEAEARDLGARLDRLARQPVPDWLRSAKAAGSA